MLAVTGGKGGCGKTTTAVGVARALATRGYDPLVIDADVDMPDLHHLVAIDRRDGVDALARGAPLDRAVQQSTTVPGVAFVTAGSPDRTAAALRATARWPGPVLVDCPAGAGPDATRPLRAAESALIVSTDERQAIEDSRRTLAVARQLGARPVGVVLRTVTRDDPPSRIGRCQVLEALSTVDDPLACPETSRAWDRIAGTVREFTSEDETATRLAPEPSTESSGVGELSRRSF